MTNRMGVYMRLSQEIDYITQKDEIAKKFKKSIASKLDDLGVDPKHFEKFIEDQGEHINNYNLNIIDKVLDAQKNTKVWNSRSGKGTSLKFLLTLIPATELGVVLFEAGFSQVQGSTGTSIDNQVADAIVELLNTNTSVREQTETALQKFKDKNPDNACNTRTNNRWILTKGST